MKGRHIFTSAPASWPILNPEAEYEETLAKAAGFLAALEVAERRLEISQPQGGWLQVE